MPFEQKSLGKTSCFALYLAKNTAPVHAFFISFLSLKRYYSIILFIILGAWSQGIKRGYVSIVVCACESRLSHARAECVNLYQSISKGCIPVSQETDQESASDRSHLCCCYSCLIMNDQTYEYLLTENHEDTCPICGDSLTSFVSLLGLFFMFLSTVPAGLAP
jgi:hypothetical protein